METISEIDRLLIPLEEKSILSEIPSEFRPLTVSRRAVSDTEKEYARRILEELELDTPDVIYRNQYINQSNQNVGFLSRHFDNLLELICTFSYQEMQSLSYDIVREKVENVLSSTLYVYNKHIDGFCYTVAVEDRDTYYDTLSMLIYQTLKKGETS